MNITKQIFKKSVLVGTIALSIAVFAGCSDSANSSTADTTKPTEAQTTVQATEGTAKSGTTNESFDLKSLHTCKENDEDDLVGTWQITSGEGSQYASFYYMFNGEGKSILISGTSGYFGKYSYDTDDDNNPTFTTKLVFGLNGTYTYKLSDDKKTVGNQKAVSISALTRAELCIRTFLTICLHIQTTRQAKVKLFQHTQPPTKKQQINTHTLLTATLLHSTMIHTQEFLSAI